MFFFDFMQILKWTSFQRLFFIKDNKENKFNSFNKIQLKEQGF